MHEYLNYLLLIVVGFMAGFINTVAGGGTLLTMPTLIFMGLPPSMANGTNRIAIFLQTIVAVYGFKTKGVSSHPFSIYIGISAFFGSLIGAQLAVDIPGELFTKILSSVMIMVVLAMIFKPKYDVVELLERTTGKYLWISIILFFFIGIYGGFINAGMGFIVLVVLPLVNRFSLVKSNATKVMVVAIYTFAALLMFAYHHKINWTLGLILALGNMSGAWIASRWSVDKGDQMVRIFVILMIVIMAFKLWFF